MLSLFLGPGNENLTFHQDNYNIPQDGEGGAQDKYGEQESADGVSNLIFWLEETNDKRKLSNIRHVNVKCTEYTLRVVFLKEHNISTCRYLIQRIKLKYPNFFSNGYNTKWI